MAKQILLKNKKIKIFILKGEFDCAETVDEINLAVWKHSSSGNLDVWTMDENWKFVNKSKEFQVLLNL